MTSRNPANMLAAQYRALIGRGAAFLATLKLNRRQMVELVRAGRNPADLAGDFEPSAQAIRS